MTSDVWVITSYFNPCRYQTKRENFDKFMAGMKAVGANVLVVELAFGDEEYELPAGDGVLHLRGNGVMWQKERLLNVAAATLPKECRKIAWLDNDLLFDDPRWLERTSEALDKYMVIQPFSSCVRLPRGEETYHGDGETYEAFAHCFIRAPGIARGGEFAHHGHTGFAWAARRELFEVCGLYDPCLTGSGDHLMSHAFAGAMVRTPCLRRILGSQKLYTEHFWRWAVKARDVVDGKLGFIPGTLLHLWHGDLVNRRYAEMNEEFMTFAFDPEKHLRLDDAGLFEWSNEAPKRLVDWSNEFFVLRREDGDPADEPVAEPVALSA